jgi:hypothetical protein
MPHQHKLSAEMNRCIQDCLDCYRVCQANASLHCLELGGQHVAPPHFRLMLDCVEACRSAAAMMLNGSDYAAEHCGMCAKICLACAQSCRELGDMDECVSACQRCAESCDRMAAMGGGQSKASAGATEGRPAH